MNRIYTISTLALYLIFHSALPFPIWCNTANTVQLKNDTILFLDDSAIERMKNIKFTLQRPIKYANNPVLVSDKPWESRFVQLYGTVLYDQEANRYRMWYSAGDKDYHDSDFLICYAESSDGIHWEKPPAGTVSIDRYTKHNILMADPNVQGFGVLYDPGEPDPSKRYKSVGGNRMGISPDGLTWTLAPFHTSQKNETSSCLIRWNDRYIAFMRSTALYGSSIRAFLRDHTYQLKPVNEVGKTESGDFEQWDLLRTVASNFMALNQYPEQQTAGLAVTPYQNMLIGLLWQIDQSSDLQTKSNVTAHLVVSHDGENWTSVGNEPFLQGTPDSWDEGGVIPSTSLVVQDGEMHLYYTGMHVPMKEPFAKESAIGLATLPVDRFVAVQREKDIAPGILLTKPYHVEGDRLLINMDAKPGDIRVELVDEKRIMMQGFELHRSKLIPFDQHRYEVVWGSQSKRLSDAPIKNTVRFRIEIKDGSLFAIQAVHHPDRPGTLQIDSTAIPKISQAEKNAQIFNKGLTAYQKGQFKQAEYYFNRCLTINPQNPHAKTYRALCYINQQQMEMAKTDLDDVLELDSKIDFAHYAQGIRLGKQKSFQKAIASISEAIFINPNQADYWADLGYLQLRNKNAVEAFSNYNKALSIDPNDKYALLERSGIYRTIGKDKEAYEDISRALFEYPDDPLLRNSRALLCLQLGMFEIAITDGLEMVSYNSQQAYYFLACANSMHSIAIQDPQEKFYARRRAVSYLQKAIENGFNNWEYAKNDPHLIPVKDMPEFQALFPNNNKNQDK